MKGHHKIEKKINNQIPKSSWGRMRHAHVTLRRQKLRILFNKIQIVAFTGKADWLGFAVIIYIYVYKDFVPHQAVLT